MCGPATPFMRNWPDPSERRTAGSRCVPSESWTGTHQMALQSAARWHDERRSPVGQAAAPSDDGDARWRSSRATPTAARVGDARQARRPARSLRRAFAVREGGPLAQRVEDAGDRLVLLAASRVGRNDHALVAALPAAPFRDSDDRTLAASAGALTPRRS